MTLSADLAARIADEQDLSKELLFWRTSSDLKDVMIDWLIQDRILVNPDWQRKAAYRRAYNRLKAAGVDLSRFPEPKR